MKKSFNFLTCFIFCIVFFSSEESFAGKKKHGLSNKEKKEKREKKEKKKEWEECNKQTKFPMVIQWEKYIAQVEEIKNSNEADLQLEKQKLEIAINEKFKCDDEQREMLAEKWKQYVELLRGFDGTRKEKQELEDIFNTQMEELLKGSMAEEKQEHEEFLESLKLLRDLSSNDYKLENNQTNSQSKNQTGNQIYMNAYNHLYMNNGQEEEKQQTQSVGDTLSDEEQKKQACKFVISLFLGNSDILLQQSVVNSTKLGLMGEKYSNIIKEVGRLYTNMDFLLDLIKKVGSEMADDYVKNTGKEDEKSFKMRAAINSFDRIFTTDVKGCKFPRTTEAILDVCEKIVFKNTDGAASVLNDLKKEDFLSYLEAVSILSKENKLGNLESVFKQERASFVIQCIEELSNEIVDSEFQKEEPRASSKELKRVMYEIMEKKYM
ncbi:hypothetical protein [Candidatus Hydrogenosomobacter endosymbioticus]|uniref:Uncharacterized protein n=1 Tax=Candidatus Hydrogenosomobacter endosymbioticus TaxID=2558174 RepID=A0ABN6L2C5_9PROT|nr:hypothetical protein [Candidatus Hydrogenosomobacter endosymbioticus]BDB96007.1 hypothetical protein HYD_1400 [Candidatus Hydrogenosomobacter endosymbioticus]